jgi:hypothetical protein
MSLKRILLSSLSAALVALALAAVPSGAVKPSANCPPPFEKLTLQEALDLAEQQGVPETEVLGLFAVTDKNRDESLCFAPLPDTRNRVGFFNVVDNTATGPH